MNDRERIKPSGASDEAPHDPEQAIRRRRWMRLIWPSREERKRILKWQAWGFIAVS